MKTKNLLQTFCIIFLFCFFTKAQETESQNILVAHNAPGKFKSFSIPFTPDPVSQASNRYHHSRFEFRYSERNRLADAFINMKSSGIWINNCTRPFERGLDFHCETSKTCQYQRPTQYTWQQEFYGDKTQVTISGSLVKEEVRLEREVTLPNTDILFANEFSDGYPTWQHYAMLGLNFRRSHPQVPTFFEYLKTEGFVEKSIFSIYMNKTFHGELIFGGYDPTRAESEFQYAKWQEDKDPEGPGFSLPTKRIGYGSTMLPEKYPVIIDFDADYVQIPELILNKIKQEKYSRGLSDEVSKSCDFIPFVEDMVIEFEEMTLRIPPAAYIKYGEIIYYEGPDSEKKTVIGCEGFLMDMEEEEERPKIILGRPFLKLFYTVFNLEEKTVGFSKIASLEKEYPFSQPKSDYPVMHYYLPLKVGGALAVLLIAKFCIMLYFIRKAQKGSQAASSENLVSPKIDVGNPEYSEVNPESPEDHQQESHNIDVGKITIEEEKFYA